MGLKAVRLVTFLGVVLASFAAIAQTPVRFTATTDNVSGAGESIKINLTNWSSDAERDQLTAAWNLTAKPAAAPAEGRGGGRGGRGGGGGRGGPRGGAAADAAPDPDAVDPDNPAFRFGRGGARGAVAPNPETPQASLSAALNKLPSVGILWTSETVGYSIKYAHRQAQPDGGERIILATDRRVGVWSNLWKPAGTFEATDFPFSIIEVRLNAKGEGEGKGALTGKVAVDPAVKSIALDGYGSLPVVLKSVKRQ